MTLFIKYYFSKYDILIILLFGYFMSHIYIYLRAHSNLYTIRPNDSLEKTNHHTFAIYIYIDYMFDDRINRIIVWYHR